MAVLGVIYAHILLVRLIDSLLLHINEVINAADVTLAGCVTIHVLCGLGISLPMFHKHLCICYFSQVDYRKVTS